MLNENRLDIDVKEYLSNKTICLIGFMGSGKTYFGEFLAKELNSILLDTDEIIEEREKRTIADIFKESGEKYFRRLEKKLLEDLVFADDSMINQRKPIIISTGGGLPIPRANRKLLRLMKSLNICMNPPFETILTRIKGSKRPLVYRRSRGYIFDLWQSRYNEYQKIANITISDVTTEEIFKSLNERIRLFMNLTSNN